MIGINLFVFIYSTNFLDDKKSLCPRNGDSQNCLEKNIWKRGKMVSCNQMVLTLNIYRIMVLFQNILPKSQLLLNKYK